jgi:hypothetical protein
LKTGRLQARACWTLTAKAVVGIALGLRFAPSLGLLREVVKTGDVLFDALSRLQIADFSAIHRKLAKWSDLAGTGARDCKTPVACVSSF